MGEEISPKIQSGQADPSGSIRGLSLRRRQLAVCATQYLIVGSDIAGATIPFKGRGRISMDLLNNSPRAACARILRITCQRTIQRAKRLARLT
jgi:hypothetical protein